MSSSNQNTEQTTNDKKRILLIAANPANLDQLALPKEFREIEDGIQIAQNRDLYEIKQSGATRYQDLRRKLIQFQPHIVHFSGHGTSKGLVLEDDQGNHDIASSQRIAELFKQFSDHVECVIFNACNSKQTAEKTHEYIDYTIGMNTPIQDKAALEFAIGFYDGIGDGRTYEDAFELGLNAISDKNKAKQTEQNNTDIPELFSKICHPPAVLTPNEHEFVGQIFSHLNQGVPQVILSQKGRDTAQMVKRLKEYAKDLFDDDYILHIYPPANPNTSETAYFRRLGRQCGFTEACHDSMEWAGLLEDMLYQDKPLFLLVTDFEKGSDECRRSLAGELRQLQEMFNNQLKLIIFGGEKLAEQVFAAGELSLLNHANTQYVPELNLHDLKTNQINPSLGEQALGQILDISGGHPLLIRHLMNGITSHNYQQELEQSPWASRLFTRYRSVNELCDKLCNWLQQEQLYEFNDWPVDELLRDLYWSNLLTRRNGKFSWRCDLIRDMGRKVLEC